MRHVRLLWLIALLSCLLAGCGGGGGGSKSVATRTITITFRWPSTTQRHAGSRYVPSAAQSAAIEIVDGASDGTANPITRLYFVQATKPTNSTDAWQSASINVPARRLLFYVNVYASATAPDPNTNVQTGLPQNVDPLNPPIARAVSLQDLTAATDVVAANVVFTMNNTATSIVPNFTNATATDGLVSLSLDNAQAALNNTVHLIDADGNTVVSPIGTSSLLQWSYDTSDSDYPLQVPTYDATQANSGAYQFKYRSALDNTDPANPLLHLYATGRVRLSVKDTEVEAPAQPIAANLTYNILPSTVVQTFALDTTNLLQSCPLNTRRVAVLLSEKPLGYPNPPANAQNQPLDAVPLLTLPSDATAPVTQTYDVTQNGSGGLTLALHSGSPTSLRYYPTGRQLYLEIKAWSTQNDPVAAPNNGAGTLLASYAQPVNQTQSPLAVILTPIAYTPGYNFN